MMTVLRTMWAKAVVVRMRARCVFVMGTVLANLLLAAPPRALAVDPDRHISQYGHTAWRVFDGTIPRPVGVTQTSDGYIWFGTRDGLMRFDGVRFSLWRSDDGMPLTKRFSALLGASDGSLWIGSLDGLMHLKNGKLYTYAKPYERAAIAAIVQDRGGTIWVSRYHVPKGSGPVCRAGEAELVCYGAKEGVPNGFALGLTQDSDGYFWIGGEVLCRWRPGSAATCFDEVGRQGRIRMDIEEFASGPSGLVWAAIDAVGPQFGVRYFSGGKWSPFIVPGFDGPSVRSHGLYVDRHNSLWVGTENNGIYRIHDGVADHYASNDGLSGNAVRSFYEDREGNLWVTTDSGLDMFRNTLVVSYSMAQGLFASNIGSILARRDGSIWIGNQGAIDILRNGEHSILSHPAMSGDSNVTLFEDHAQTVWLGVGPTLLAYRNGRFFDITRPDGSPLGQNYALAITEDADGEIWALASSAHLFRIKGRKVVGDIPLGESLSSAFFLEPDKSGGVWIGDKSGMFARYHAGQLETYSLKDDKDPISVHEMIVDTDNSLLISTERGLVRWSNGQHTALGMKNGLPCEAIYSAIKDDNGSLWLYARCGLLQIEASQVAKWEGSPTSPISARLFDAHDGALPGIRAPRQHLSTKAPDGRLWFTNGLLAQVVDPKHLSRNEVIPPVAIEDVIADRKVLGAQAGMRVPALTRDLQIDYTALSFVVPQNVHFQYKLDGYDRDWQDAGNRRQAFYSKLPPRDYTFRVKACNNSGLWNEAGASLDFFVAPAYYQTKWFRLSCVAIFIALLWALHRWRVHRLARQEKHLRDVVETIPAMTFTALSDGSSTFVNKGWTAYTGLSIEKTSGAGWQRAIHPEDLGRHSKKWRVSVATGQPFEDEARFRRAVDGEYRWFLVRGVPLRDRHGKIIRWYGTLTDIEDHKRAEEALVVLSRDLQESKAKLEEAQRITHVGYWEWDIVTGRVNWSDETYRIYGMEPQERPMNIAACQEKIYPEDWERGMKEALGSGARFNAECRVIRPTGEVRIAHFQGDVKRDASDRPYHMFGTVQDITDRKRAEEALQQSQFYLSEGQRLAHMGSWALNPSGFFEYWSQVLFKIYGLDPQKGAPTLEQYLATVHPQDRDFMANTIKRMHAERGGCDVKKRIVRPDGELRYIRCVGIPVVEGEVLKGFLGTAIDITEQEMLTQELERQQAHLTEAQKLTHTGSWAWRGPDRSAVEVSEEFYRICGFDPAEGVPTLEDCFERVHPEDRLKWRGTIERAVVEKADYDHEFRFLLPNGIVKWIRTVGHPLLSSTGDLEGFVGSSTDITERKHAEEAVRSSEAYLVEAQSLTHTGSYAIDGTSRETVYWSDEMFRLFGFDPQQGLPMFDQWVQRIHPEDRDKVKLASERAFLTKVNYDVEFRILEPDGTVKHIHGIGHPVLSATGELLQVLGTMVDVTEGKRAEEARDRLRQLEAELAHTNRVSTMGEMAASLAHEIKQPITAAVSNAEACLRWLARDQPDMSEMREAATETVKEARRAAEIINRTRSLFQKEVIKREAVDVNEVINEVACLVRKEAALYSISVRTEFGAGLPKVSANHVQLQQVLMNLMLNGIEAMKDAPDELIIKSQLDEQGRVLISVRDTGVGLPAENADKIFNAFFTTKPQGTGMGLAISRSIVESHGGRLWAQANLGRGATFNFTLPHDMVMSA